MPRARSAAIAIALITVAAGWTWNTRVAGGADSYGYVSQADLWRQGRLMADQPSFLGDVPWPRAADTFSPLGYRPSLDGTRLVPIYSPGLPMAMAAAERTGGAGAAYWVVPLAGGMLVLATFAIGRRVGGDVAALAAASLTVTSPTFLYMLVQPMSDVPAAAAWASAVACLLGESTAAAGVAGIAASLAVLVRPNLVPLTAILAFWIFGRCTRRAALVFVLCAAIGPIVVALLNARLHGSLFASGYDLSEGFSWSHILPNLRRYSMWLVTAEPALVLGVFGLAAAMPGQWLLAAIVVAVTASYVIYVPWDAWWYLRFLLPAFPMLAVGTGLLISRTRRAAAPVTLALAAFGVWQAAQRDAFTLHRVEAKYVAVARTVQTTTGPNDVMISAQHSGSLRHYANRLTLRWDFMDPVWLDRAVAWLGGRGHRVFFVLDADEVAAVRERFATSSVVGRLDWPPIVSYADGTTEIFDGTRRDPDTRTQRVSPRSSSR